MRSRPTWRVSSGSIGRATRALGVLLLAGGSVVLLSPGVAEAAASECNVMPGTTYTGQPWQQTRLNFPSVWPISRGANVTVAVLDSGLDANVGPKNGPVHIQMHTVPGVNVMPTVKGQAAPTGTADCFKHGTEVASIIAATRTDSAFLGVAPDATIMPIKMTDGNNGGIAQSTLSLAIRTAVNAGVQIINISAAANGDRANFGPLEKAVRYAASRGVVIVAAAGNDGGSSNLPGFPAAFSPYDHNVIAVSAIDDNDAVASFSESGSYVTVAAPGVDVWVASANGYLKESGTSYAAPYVSGTIALMLAAHPELRGHPDLIRDRLIATADPPPVRVPDPHYGYGVVDPYLAVTSILSSSPAPSSAAPRRAVGVPLVAHPADRRLQHIALAVGLSLLGLAVLVAVGSAVYRAADRNRTGGAHASS